MILMIRVVDLGFGGLSTAKGCFFPICVSENRMCSSGALFFMNENVMEGAIRLSFEKY